MRTRPAPESVTLRHSRPGASSLQGSPPSLGSPPMAGLPAKGRGETVASHGAEGAEGSRTTEVGPPFMPAPSKGLRGSGPPASAAMRMGRRSLAARHGAGPGPGWTVTR
uniref:hypothetical protein n=1 Tax=Arthrobacter sp. H35-MC1 TaxID=3046203 RepID=UPI0024BB273A|nr:hypothetical protein [Arthrobacter sp. H35-MC1]